MFVTTIDLGDEKNVHPKDKLPIELDLALLAEKHTLIRNVVSEGAILKVVKAQNNTLIISFKKAQGFWNYRWGKAPLGFWMQNEFIALGSADSKLDGETVVLYNDKLRSPYMCRYAFAGKPDV